MNSLYKITFFFYVFAFALFLTRPSLLYSCFLFLMRSDSNLFFFLSIFFFPFLLFFVFLSVDLRVRRPAICDLRFAICDLRAACCVLHVAF